VAPPPQLSDDDLPTVEALVRQKREEIEARLAQASQTREAKPVAPEPADAPSATEAAQDANEDSHAPKPDSEGAEGVEGGVQELEEEADAQGAFNPETGEINWACPCLGGMADGPCGEEFKAAFSCFVYSTEEPKGMDCIEKFQ
jgi:mitochondrial intermembrane space import and assembly protein 40